MKIRFLITLLFFFVGCVQLLEAKEKKDKEEVSYDIQSAGSGVQGTYLVSVWVYSKTGKVNDDLLKYAAVHGVLFRGFSGQQGAPTQRPLAGSAVVEQQKSDYFQAFFGEEGAYLNFATVVMGSYQRVKVKKRGYKVGAVLQVSKDQLRRELEQAGVIKSLSSGF